MQNTIPIFPNTIIYVSCPPNYATGGPEALHQIAHCLAKLGANVYMYYDFNELINPVHPYYEKYGTKYTSIIEDNEANIIIIPETSLEVAFDPSLKKIRKAVWWLSVSNYYMALKKRKKKARKNPMFWIKKVFNPIKLGTFQDLLQSNILHIYHSYYSKVHLNENGIKTIGGISDYMNEAFFNQSDDNKEDTIIYNPQKNGAFLDKIIRATPNLKWQPLKGLTPEQVSNAMAKSKLYVDFGFHPGKERMPREACIMKCCLIIGKDGSAKYEEDMPIPGQFRFEKEDKEIPSIIQKINDCIGNYEQEIEYFKTYRNVLLSEEKQFNKDVSLLFAFDNPDTLH